MKVTRELKELLGRKLQKIYNNKYEQQVILLKKKHVTIAKEMKKLYEDKEKASKKFSDRKEKLNKSQKEYYVDYKGDLDITSPKVNFDIDEHLYGYIEKLELTNDKEGIFGSVLKEIQKL